MGDTVFCYYYRLFTVSLFASLQNKIKKHQRPESVAVAGVFQTPGEPAKGPGGNGAGGAAGG